MAAKHFVLGCAPGRALVGGPAVDEPWCVGRLVELPSSAAPMVFTLDPEETRAPSSIYQGLIPLWSDPLMNAMRAAGVDNVQAHAALLQDPRTGKPWPVPYWAVNVLGVVAAVDLRASGLPNDDAVRADLALSSFQIDAKRAAPFRVFRLAETISFVVVDEEVRRAINRAQLDDVQLTAPGPAADEMP